MIVCASDSEVATEVERNAAIAKQVFTVNSLLSAIISRSQHTSNIFKLFNPTTQFEDVQAFGRVPSSTPQIGGEWVNHVAKLQPGPWLYGVVKSKPDGNQTRLSCATCHRVFQRYDSVAICQPNRSDARIQGSRRKRFDELVGTLFCRQVDVCRIIEYC